MIASWNPCTLKGTIAAPPSKSMAHRYLIGAVLSGEDCVLEGIDFSEDILASMDCLKALGADITMEGDRILVETGNFMQVDKPVLECRESGSTLRFFIPLVLCLGKPVIFHGSQRLMERPLEIYEELCRDHGFVFQKEVGTVTVCGNLQSGNYTLRGDVSSQFITGMILALVYRNQEASITILPPFESRSYIDLTISALQSYGADVDFVDTYRIEIRRSEMHGGACRIEGDYSNAAFLDAFNLLGSSIRITNLNPVSLQGDQVYQDYFKKIEEGTPTLDLSDCPDLGPVLFAMAAMKNGAVFTGTDRLKAKESDRGQAMYEELRKLGGGLLFGENTITVPKQKLQYQGRMLNGHNDHRIVMALSVILSRTGGCIEGVQAVRKSYPGFFEDLKRLGAEVELK